MFLYVYVWLSNYDILQIYDALICRVILGDAHLNIDDYHKLLLSYSRISFDGNRMNATLRCLFDTF